MVAHVLLAKSGERVNDLHFEIGAEFQDSLDFNFCEPRARKIALLLGRNKSTWIEEWEEKTKRPHPEINDFAGVFHVQNGCHLCEACKAFTDLEEKRRNVK